MRERGWRKEKNVGKGDRRGDANCTIGLVLSRESDDRERKEEKREIGEEKENQKINRSKMTCTCTCIM